MGEIFTLLWGSLFQHIWAQFVCCFAESRFPAAVLCNAVWMCDTGMSRDAAHVYCYWAGNTNQSVNWFHESSLSIIVSIITCRVAQAVRAVSRGDLLQTFPLWQMRLVVELWNSRVMHGPAKRHDALLTSEFLPVMKNMVDVALDTWLKGEKWRLDASWFKPTFVHFVAAVSDVTWLKTFPELFSCVAQSCQGRLCTTHWTITLYQRPVLTHNQSNTCFWWCGKQVKYCSWTWL